MHAALQERIPETRRLLEIESPGPGIRYFTPQRVAIADSYPTLETADLPIERQRLYNWQRRSQIFIKTL